MANIDSDKHGTVLIYLVRELEVE
jgi:hypothetical protein